MRGDTGDAGGLPDGRRTYAPELLTSLGAKRLDTAVVDALWDEDVLKAFKLRCLLSLSLDVATILDEDLSALDELGTTTLGELV